MIKKDSNPKDALGTKKVPMSVIPGPVMMEVGNALLEGALKYGRHNYREIGVKASVYFDATMRHMWQFWEGQDIDPDSGIHHVTKAIASLCVLRDSMMRGNWSDDRPPKSEDGWVADMNCKSARLVNKYPDPPAPVTQLSQKQSDNHS